MGHEIPQIIYFIFFVLLIKNSKLSWRSRGGGERKKEMESEIGKGREE